MENHGLGTHNDNMCADISTGNTPNTPQLIRPVLDTIGQLFGIF